MHPLHLLRAVDHRREAENPAGLPIGGVFTQVSVLSFYPQNCTVLGALPKEANVAVALRKYSTSVLSSSAEYMPCSDG